MDEDDRTWWEVSAAEWPGSVVLAAAAGPEAVEQYRAFLAGYPEPERGDHWASKAELKVSGPLSTREAYEIDLGWVLAWQASRWTRQAPTRPITRQEAQAVAGYERVVAWEVRLAHDYGVQTPFGPNGERKR